MQKPLNFHFKTGKVIAGMSTEPTKKQCVVEIYTFSNGMSLIWWGWKLDYLYLREREGM